VEERITAGTLPRRDLVFIVSCIVLLTGLAWAYLLHLDRQMAFAMDNDRRMIAMGMAGMDMNQPWTLTLAMWAVMMAGMMVPSAVPVFLLYANAKAARGESSTSPSVLLFGSGYLTVWTAFSACAALAQWALHQAALLSPAMKLASPRVAGTVLIAAGLYQLTPWKQKCLTHCRSPLGFLMTHWRDGPRGAFQMGFVHGAFCLGCCWVLMAILFALGVMNLIWVAALTAFVLLEKIGPAGVIVGRVAGAALVVLGLFYWVTFSQ